ncbi:MAG: DUF4010 domain-containing protein [Kiritimatiellaeota bacterium]|nr:DUF4010 domain-containing protein [Kiritimatiellota bacterium]
MHALTGAMDGDMVVRFLLALALGFLLGLERESAYIGQRKVIFGGVRTFPILSLYGFACGWLHQLGVAWLLPAGLLSVLALASLSYADKLRRGLVGATSEIAALLIFVVGAMTLLTDLRLAMALGVISTLLLSEKAALESFVERVDKVEFLATLRFLLVTFIIYPVLPNRDFTAYHLNPANIWRLVILVSAIGFVGYFLVKQFGQRVGLWLSGLMGGIVSSTAMSIAAGRMARNHPARAPEALQAALLAGSVMYVRVLVLIGVLNYDLAVTLGWKFALLAGAGVLLALSAWHRPAVELAAPAQPDVRNPFEIRPALIFALLFVALKILTEFIRNTRFGQAGVLSLAGFTGLVDVDPFILSLAQDPGGGTPLVLQAILVAVLSNTLVKGVYFSAQARTLWRGALLRYALWGLLHVPLLWFL